MNTTEYNSPQILNGSVDLAAAMSQTITLDTMASRSQRWYAAHELSVSLSISEGEADYLGRIVNIRSRAYKNEMMLNYLPVWLMGPRQHIAAEYTNASTNAAGFSQFETYLWKFPKPFYIPPGGAFVVQMQRNGSQADLDAEGVVHVEIALRGMQLSTKEGLAAAQKIRQQGNPIPYMSAYTPLTFPNKSNNLDLANPFLVPLFLQRMTARIADANFESLGQSYAVDTGYQIQLSDTREVICETTDILNVFPATKLAWTHTRILQPQEYITAELSRDSGKTGYPQVAIIGFRNEAT